MPHGVSHASRRARQCGRSTRQACLHKDGVGDNEREWGRGRRGGGTTTRWGRDDDGEGQKDHEEREKGDEGRQKDNEERQKDNGDQHGREREVQGKRTDGGKQESILGVHHSTVLCSDDKVIPICHPTYFLTSVDASSGIGMLPSMPVPPSPALSARRETQHQPSAIRSTHIPPLSLPLSLSLALCDLPCWLGPLYLTQAWLPTCSSGLHRVMAVDMPSETTSRPRTTSFPEPFAQGEQFIYVSRLGLGELTLRAQCLPQF